MPVEETDKYIRIRVKDPDLFVDDSFRTIIISAKEGIHAIIGKLKTDPDGSTVVQAYLFEKNKWTVDEAKNWVKEHKEKNSLEIDDEHFNKSAIEKRTFQINEFRIDKDEKKIVGHAAVFDTLTTIFGFKEKVSLGAFKSSIKKDDIRALFNHDPNLILGRNKAGTLKLKEDDKGLAIEISPPDTQFARDLMVLMERGDISQMSFSFQTLEELWENEDQKIPTRTLLKVKLFDVSPVTFPAYENTDVAVRSYETWKQQQIPERPWRLNLLRRRLNLTIGGK